VSYLKQAGKEKKEEETKRKAVNARKQPRRSDN
jgi:hypothetical protein